MKPHAITLLLLALASSAGADDQTEQFSRCIAHSPNVAPSADCTALRATFQAEVNDCMANRVAAAPAPAKPGGGSAAHAYKAGRHICERQIAADHGVPIQ